MDYSTFFFFCIIFAFIGFISTKIWGIDVYRIFSDLGAFIVLVPFLSLLIIKPESVNETADILSNLMISFGNALPSMIIGDVAGTLVAGFVKPFGE